MADQARAQSDGINVSQKFHLRGVLKGHSGWVTCLATTQENPSMLLSGSRDRSLIIWELTKDGENYGYPKKSLSGHSHFVQDVVISSDGQFALSGSWDSTLRLWDLTYGTSTRTFIGHSKDVLSVAFSPGNRQIVSGSRDKTIKLWNTLGECKYTIEEQGHTEWVSSVRFSPATSQPVIVSGGHDKLVKVWNLTNCKLRTNLPGHTGYINAVTVSPDGSLCASGGKDGIARLWELNKGAFLYNLEGPTSADAINALAFSPSRFWLCAATNKSVLIWDLESQKLVAELQKKDYADFGAAADQSPSPISLAWSADGTTLFVGYTDNLIRVWEVRI